MSLRKGSLKRRDVIKAMGASSGALASGTGLASASEDYAGSDGSEDPIGYKLLEAAGDPDIQDKKIEQREAEGGNVLVRTTLQTEIGELVHVESSIEIGGKSTDLYFAFDDLTGSHRSQIPHRYRSAPPESDLYLIYYEGNVHPRRTASTAEREALSRVIDAQASEFQAVFDGRIEAFELFGDEEVRRRVYVSSDTPSWKTRRDHWEETVDLGQQVAPLRAGRYTIEKIEYTVGIVDSCFGFVGPCTQCVFGGGVCGGCAGLCSITGGAGCVFCILGCGGTGVTCGCCLACLDNTPTDCEDI